MNTSYAVIDPASHKILHESSGFDEEKVSERIPFSDGKELWICRSAGDKMSKEELLIRLQDAEAANIAKEAFLSNMSHDIRTPMNAIVGMTALAQKHIDEKGRVADALAKIETASGHLLSLINDVLDMSRINSGRMEIKTDVFSLDDLLHELLTVSRPLIEQKHHTLKIITDHIEIEEFNGDVLRIRQIFINILSNAIKYTPDHGEITMTVESARHGFDGDLFFQCSDNGVGMTEEFIQKIFEPFERVHSSTVSGIEGTGLGMSIVKKLIDAMHGTIEVESAPGKGTTIRIHLPLSPVIESDTITDLSDVQVLILESGQQKDTFRRYLEDAGIAFELVPSVQDAMSRFAQADIDGKSYDVFILGSVIQGAQNGLEIAEYLHKSYPQVPLIMCCDQKWEEIEYRAQKCGITAMIPVPFFRKTLVKGIADALSRSTNDSTLSSYPNLEGKRILLVEDNLINREIAREILSMTHAFIDTAENGREAVDMFTASKLGTYQMILMDIKMPVMDGYTATGLIRTHEHPDAKYIPILAMTANTFAEDIEKARKCGMSGHIAKPVDIDHLMRVLCSFSGKGE